MEHVGFVMTGLTTRLERASASSESGRGERQLADVFSATAARMSALNAFSSIVSPSWISMARLHVAVEAGVEEA